jgi:hypothetical protein
MTACLPLQDCIVQTTRPEISAAELESREQGYRQFGNSAIVLHAYSRHYMGAARLQWQVFKLHGYARRCPAAAAVFQTAYKCSAVTCSAVQCSAVQCSAVQCSAVQCSADTRYQSACTRRLLPCCSGRIDIKLHARVAALLQWQVLFNISL